ncbi:uncharacterized protein LOC127079898 [Lathyrus oleraceus]|uniref:uncharacterized protein LOC127079898 n=1 Tax=Pisum sativum TaxID=3888 RepID=UPI0021D0F31D|nr:uncharacterized protein LOC127079898 [Pisum sativum]
MDFGRRRTQKYTFKSPKLEDLRELGDLVISPIGFKDRYGILLSLLKTNITDGILATLVQFYDPLYHCFTFPDYQLMPILEEYSYLLGSPISDHMTTKGGILGLPTKFLIDKAHYFASMKSMDAFETILSLLIYGLVIFPNVDKFVDINAIKIFLIGNPIPTLLADGLLWSQKIMSLTHSDIEWYSHAYDEVNIFDSCGEFPNVPLLGTKGGIIYNPILARSQLGYPMKDKPSNILLEGLFFKEGEDNKALKEKIVHAWHHVHKKGREVLGKPGCVSLEPYLQWVQARAIKFKMPYPLHKPLSIASKEPTLIFMIDAEKLLIDLTKNHPSPDSQETIQRTVISEIVSTPVSVEPLSDPHYHLPSDFPWGMPLNYMPEGYHPHATKAPVVTTVMSVPHPVVHTTPYNEEHIFHIAPSEGVGMDERMDEF